MTQNYDLGKHYHYLDPTYGDVRTLILEKVIQAHKSGKYPEYINIQNYNDMTPSTIGKTSKRLHYILEFFYNGMIGDDVLKKMALMALTPDEELRKLLDVIIKENKKHLPNIFVRKWKQFKRWKAK